MLSPPQTRPDPRQPGPGYDPDRGISNLVPVGQPGSAAYRRDIDGLRALAVVAVILNHANRRLLPGGYLGVDIFFVISGFVITMSLARHREASFGPFLIGFYARRCRRLVPALATCALASGLAAWLIDPDPIASLRTGMAALLGLSNIALLQASQDYFAPGSQLNMFTQTWSLGVEEQFYLLFPALVWLSGLGRTPSGARRLLNLCLGISALSLVVLFLLPGHRGGAAYFLVLGRFWELGAGCAAALLALTHPDLVRRLARPALAWAAFLLVLTILALPVPRTVLASLLVVPPTVVLILAGPSAGPVRRLLSYGPLVAVGVLSYSLYLWHWPVLSVNALAFGSFPGQVPLELTLTAALATAAYFLVERPARSRLALLRPAWSYLVSGAAITAVGGLLLVMLLVPNAAPLAQRRFLDVPPPFLTFPVTGAAQVADCAVEAPTRPLKPTIMERCTVPPQRAGQPTLWAMGDSHAGHLLGMLAALQRQEGFGIHLVETPGQPFPVPPGVELPERDAVFQATLPRLRRGDIIVLGRLFLRREDPVAPWPGIPQWIAKVEALAEEMRPRGVQVVVVGPSPMFRFASIYGCRLGAGGVTTCDVGRADLAAVIDPIEATLAHAAGRHANLHLFNPFPILCPPGAQACSPVKDGIPQYRDRDHLNAVGSAGLAPAFLRFVTALRQPG